MHSQQSPVEMVVNNCVTGKAPNSASKCYHQRKKCCNELQRYFENFVNNHHKVAFHFDEGFEI